MLLESHEAEVTSQEREKLPLMQALSFEARDLNLHQAGWLDLNEELSKKGVVRKK